MALTILLKDEANKLTNPSLQRGIVETVIDKGAAVLVSMIPWDTFTGSTYDFNIEKDLPTGDSVEDPYDDVTADGVGEPERLAREVGMLARNVDTPIVNEQGKSDFNQQRARDVMSGAKKLAKDFVRHFIAGKGSNPGLEGLEFWAEKYAGHVSSDGTRTYLDVGFPRFDDQKKVYTDDQTPGGTAVALDSKGLREFLNLSGDEPFTALLVDEDTEVDIQLLLEDMPGNMAQHVQDENLGRPVLTFNGTKIHKMWGVGDVKESVTTGGDGITLNATTEVLVVPAGSDKKWIGFTDLDIKRDFTITDGTDTYAGTIEEVTDSRTVEVSWTSDPGVDIVAADGYTITVAKTRVIYGVRFDVLDGVCAYYHANTGVPADPGQQYKGPIAGFNVTDVGRLQVGKRAVRSQLDWFGNFAVKNPRAVARMSHFARYSSA